MNLLLYRVGLLKMRGRFMKNSGYITVEASIIMPFVMLIFAAVLLFSMFYHDVVVNRLDAQSVLIHSYFGVKEDSRLDVILHEPYIENSEDRGLLSRELRVRSHAKKDLPFFDFEVDFGYEQYVRTINKKAVLRTLDVVDNIYGIFADEEVREKIGKIKSKIKIN